MIGRTIFIRLSPKFLIFYRKKIKVSIRKMGIRMHTDHFIYPKKEGILILFSSASWKP